MKTLNDIKKVGQEKLRGATRLQEDSNYIAVSGFSACNTDET